MSETSTDRQHRLLWIMIQSLITAVLLGWLVASIAWQEVLAALSGASIVIMLLACLMYYIGVTISCWKWQLLLRLEGITPPFGQLYRWYMIGAFAANYLPTEVGGDVGRALLAGKATGRFLAVSRSILFERLTGLIFMLVLAWVGLIVILGYVTLAIVVALIGFFGLIVLGIVIHQVLYMKLVKGSWTHRLWLYLPEKARNILASVRQLGVNYQQPLIIAFVLALSLGFQILAGCGVWLNLSAVGIQLPLAHVVLVAAMVSTVTLLPITLNGWGLREALIVALLTPLGIDPGSLLAGALVGRGLNLLVTLPGGVLLLFKNSTTRTLPKSNNET